MDIRQWSLKGKKTKGKYYQLFMMIHDAHKDLAEYKTTNLASSRSIARNLSDQRPEPGTSKRWIQVKILTVIITALKVWFLARSLLPPSFESTEIDHPPVAGSPSKVHANDNTSVPSFTLPSPTSLWSAFISDWKITTNVYAFPTIKKIYRIFTAQMLDSTDKYRKL